MLAGLQDNRLAEVPFCGQLTPKPTGLFIKTVNMPLLFAYLLCGRVPSESLWTPDADREEGGGGVRGEGGRRRGRDEKRREKGREGGREKRRGNGRVSWGRGSCMGAPSSFLYTHRGWSCFIPRLLEACMGMRLIRTLTQKRCHVCAG